MSTRGLRYWVSGQRRPDAVRKLLLGDALRLDVRGRLELEYMLLRPDRDPRRRRVRFDSEGKPLDLETF